MARARWIFAIWMERGKFNDTNLFFFSPSTLAALLLLTSIVQDCATLLFLMALASFAWSLVVSH